MSLFKVWLLKKKFCREGLSVLKVLSPEKSFVVNLGIVQR